MPSAAPFLGNGYEILLRTLKFTLISSKSFRMRGFMLWRGQKAGRTFRRLTNFNSRYGKGPVEQVHIGRGILSDSNPGKCLKRGVMHFVEVSTEIHHTSGALRYTTIEAIRYRGGARDAYSPPVKMAPVSVPPFLPLKRANKIWREVKEE